VQEPEEAMYQLTTNPEAAPDVANTLRSTSTRACPSASTAWQWTDRPGDHAEYHRRAARRGRIDLVENRLVGMKSHGVYETPGGTLICRAHEGLEQICLDKQSLQYKQMLALKYAELTYNGQWFTPIREALDAFVAVTQRNVTGDVRLKLYKGNIMLVGRKSPHSLYREDYATSVRKMSTTRKTPRASSSCSGCR